MPLKRIFKFVSENRKEIFTEKDLILSYLAGVIDGDGSKGSLAHLVIFYGPNERNEAEIDSQLINSIGFKTMLKKKKNHIRLYILKPSKLFKQLSRFVVLKRKFNTA